MIRNETQTVKIIKDTIEELSFFIGQNCVNLSAKAIQSQMTNMLGSLCNLLDVRAPKPIVDVYICRGSVEITFRDPKEGDNITLDVWASRANKGYYE